MNSFAFLVGGFASSPWLTDQLNLRLSDLGLKFFKPHTNTNKAVAVGAVSFYIDRFVRGRISKFTYGVPYFAIYSPFNPEHVKREDKTHIDLEGDKCVPDAFATLLSKGTKVLESREIRTTVSAVREGASGEVWAGITKYDGNQKEPEWVDIERDRFETLCHVVADIPASSYTRKPGISGKMCSVYKFDVVLMVGLTELKAQIRWLDSNGKEKSGDAVIVYKDASENSCTDPKVASSRCRGGRGL